MESKQIKLGSVSLLCTFLVLCVAVLTVLCIATVQADWQLTRRSAEVTTQRYQLQNEGQLWLSRLDAALRRDGWDKAVLPEGGTRDGESITATLTNEGRSLSIRVERPEQGSVVPWRVTRWQETVQWDEEEELQLYKGDLP